MNEVRAREVFVGRRDHAAMGVLEPVQTRLEPVHRDPPKVNDIAPHGAFVGGNERAHQVLVFKDHIGLRDDLFTQRVFHMGLTAHSCPGLLPYLAAFIARYRKFLKSFLA